MKEFKHEQPNPKAGARWWYIGVGIVIGWIALQIVAGIVERF